MIGGSTSAKVSHPLLVVTGMAKEMRIAAGPGVIAVGSGGDAGRLRELLATRRADRHRGVLSFGLAGGLDPTLRPGDVIMATAVLEGLQRWPVDGRIAKRMATILSGGGMPAESREIAGVDAPLMQAGEKRALSKTGAAAADMESHIAASYAAAHDLPFIGLRVVCDPAERSLPPLAAKALRPDGRTDYPAVALSLMRDPTQLPAMLRLARDAGAAFRSLRRCGDLLGIGRGGADLVELLRDIP